MLVGVWSVACAPERVRERVLDGRDSEILDTDLESVCHRRDFPLLVRDLASSAELFLQ
jgi:hypothetical protein